MRGIKMRRLSLRCLMLGHDDRIQRASGRMFLECAECGRETRGWNLSDRSTRAATRFMAAHANYTESPEFPVSSQITNEKQAA